MTHFLYLVRHGEAVPHDGPLSPAGEQQAQLTGSRLKDVPLSAIHHGPLPRAAQTASLIVAGFSAAERAQGPRLAAAAIDRFTQAGPGDGDSHELIVTHNFLIGWLVSQALAAPSWRWLGLNQMNCALSVIAYRAGLPPALIIFNDAGHLTPELRWGGFPADVRPASG